MKKCNFDILMNEYLQSIVTIMLSKDDIKNLLAVLATKQDLESLREKVATKAQYNDVLSKVDKVYGELKDFRQEQSAHSGQHEELDKDIGNLQERINKIEQTA